MTAHSFRRHLSSPLLPTPHPKGQSTYVAGQLALPSAQMAANTDWGTVSDCTSQISPNNI